MQRYYSPSTGCTYLASIHGEQMPADVLAISETVYLDVIASPASGKVRSHGSDGTPILVDAPALAAPTREMIEATRLRAYADPVVGSDRHFNEAARESLLGNEIAAGQARQLGLARFAEIQREHPWPDVSEQTQ